MKLTLYTLVAFSLLTSAQTCSNSGKTNEPGTTATYKDQRIEITGTIQVQGMTSYQYGTHTISTANNDFFALKSDALELKNYIDKEVTIVAEKIDGYPLSGGPDYLLVLEVKGK